MVISEAEGNFEDVIEDVIHASLGKNADDASIKDDGTAQIPFVRPVDPNQDDKDDEIIADLLPDLSKEKLDVITKLENDSLPNADKLPVANSNAQLKMKGVILAGGHGTRLEPLTKFMNKHLIPVYDRPMIFLPIQTMEQAGIKEIMIVTNPEYVEVFKYALRNGFGESLLNFRV